MRQKKYFQDYQNHISTYINELKSSLDQIDVAKIEQAIDILMQVYKRGDKVFIIGNGGSAANASHMASDLSKGTLRRVYDESESRFKAYSLTDNVAILTAFANDVGFSDIFVQQLRNLIDRGDVLIALSGSGNSENVVRAVKYAKRRGAKTIGFLGFKNGGRTGRLVDCAIVVQSMSYGICEDIQLVLDHIITSWITKIKSL